MTCMVGLPTAQVRLCTSTGVDYIDPEIIKWEYGVELNC